MSRAAARRTVVASLGSLLSLALLAVPSVATTSTPPANTGPHGPALRLANAAELGFSATPSAAGQTKRGKRASPPPVLYYAAPEEPPVVTRPLPVLPPRVVSPSAPLPPRVAAHPPQSMSPRQAPPSDAADGSTTFVLSSFNVLGGSHTAAGGNRARMAPGPVRIRWAAELLDQRGVDVVGFQEHQMEQLRVFLDSTEGEYQAFPGFREGGRGANNTIAWRSDTWELVKGDTAAIPYFNGSRWPMPVVLLRHRETGQTAYFFNVHNPASTRNHPNSARWRDLALDIEIRLINRLVATDDVPVFFTGDLNERRDAFCAVVGRTPLEAANGGSADAGCRPPDNLGIDWIFGSPEAEFLDYEAVDSSLVDKTSDHPMVVARIRLPG